MMRSLKIAVEHWALREPFRISGYAFTHADLVVVTLEEAGARGQGEAAGVYYKGETPEEMERQIETVRGAIEAGADRNALRELLPPGGARNAVDCALWDLEAKLSGVPAWQTAGLQMPTALSSTYTIGAEPPEKVALAARAYAPARLIKLKLTGDESDAARLKAARRARPDAWIAIDANQGFTREKLDRLMPLFVDIGVQMIEQPVAVGREDQLDRLNSPIPIAADESVQSLDDIAAAKGRFDVINIKLDKCGGLTEALMMAERVREAGMRPMVGCMSGTSLAMIPGCLAGQVCDFVDMDGAMPLAQDREPSVVYRDGRIICTARGWGSPSPAAAEALIF